METWAIAGICKGCHDRFCERQSRPWRYLVGRVASAASLADPVLAAEKWRLLVGAAGYAYETSRPIQVQELLEEALEHTEPGTAVLNNLAIVLEFKAFFDAAEALYGWVIDIWTGVQLLSHPNVSCTSANL